MHAASGETFTYYDLRAARFGRDRHSARLHGNSCPQLLALYFQYTEATHGLCNALHLRELKFIAEHYQQEWACGMVTLLLNMKKEVDVAQSPGQSHLAPLRIQEFERRCEALVAQGLEVNPPTVAVTPQLKRQGRVKQTPPKNLLDRLKGHRWELLAFLHDFKVPFDTHQAKQDTRMVKVKQEVSGTFRRVEGAKMSCLIRRYTSTARKNGQRAIVALQAALAGSLLSHPLAQLNVLRHVES